VLLAPAVSDDEHSFDTSPDETGRVLELALAGTTGLVDSDDSVSVWNADLLNMWSTLWPPEAEAKGSDDWAGGTGG
jgi:hypothetical protein